MIIMQRTFQVSIEETLRKTIFINAENEEEAYKIAEDLYKNEEEVLTPDDFVEYDIFVDGEVTDYEQK